jgi:hypothetical protein
LAISTASHKGAELDALAVLPAPARDEISAAPPARMKTQEVPQLTARLWESIFT